MNKRFFNKVLAASVFASAAAMPFFFISQEAAVPEDVPKLAICEPFPECYIYRADEESLVNKAL
ncbi:hypothetical protein [Shewanella sp.]|uniref:hypothetical protein n=1 Tax=Shewanella sp. TaxID=50422 RepID=UPI003569925F